MSYKLKQAFTALDPIAKDVLHRGLHVFIVCIIGAIAAFLMAIALARHLSVSEYGLFYLSLTIITILAVINRLGLDDPVIRDIKCVGHPLKTTWVSQNFASWNFE